MAGSTLHVGSVVEGKYQIIELLGRGGMSHVWLARDRRLEKLWAVKEIRPNVDGVRGERMRQALLDEASFMKLLDHPAIPRIVDIVDNGEDAFVIMDYVEGRSLAARMRLQQAPFTQQEVLGWGIQICDVLSYLHGLTPPVLYRDLKPANLIVREDGSLRLIDFGIAAELDVARGAGESVGTPGYAAPEQLAPPSSGSCMRDIDARADIYSLGVTLYVLVTGHAPRVRRDEDGAAHVDFAPRPLREWDARLSEGLERIVLRAICAEPDGRYRSASEMRYDLEHYEELTDQWRDERLAVLRRFRHRLMRAGVSLGVGLACLWAGNALLKASYADLVHEAETASRVAATGQTSDAERLYLRAIELEPERIEAYRSLMEVYVADGCLDKDESARWQRACGPQRGLAQDPQYARLCLDVAVSYLAYFGVGDGGAAQGSVALESMEAAVPWLERALGACEGRGALPQGIDEGDLFAAKTYLVIARFHSEATRVGREGVSGGETYRGFWDALDRALREASDPAFARVCPEGLRLRLCQACEEALASPSYLAGISRAGIVREEAEGMLDRLELCLDGLEGFASSPDYAVVYGPLFAGTRAGLGLARENIETTYGNPVAVWDAF